MISEQANAYNTLYFYTDRQTKAFCQPMTLSAKLVGIYNRKYTFM